MINDVIKILGVRIDNLSVGKIKEKIGTILDQPAGKTFVTTLNPEILLKAYRDKEYRNILNSADLNICDGFGLKIVSVLRGGRIRNRFTGVELANFLLETANRKNLGVLIIAARNSLSKPAEIEQAIIRKYPNISVKSQYFVSGQVAFFDDIIEEADIVFINFGAPDQEKFIYANRSKFSRTKLLVGVGGTFDFLTGKIRRAPIFLRKIGLEWFWRLIQEPKRWRRIIDAVFVFPLIATTYKD